jgi:hypothetical protein
MRYGLVFIFTYQMPGSTILEKNTGFQSLGLRRYAVLSCTLSVTTQTRRHMHSYGGICVGIVPYKKDE